MRVANCLGLQPAAIEPPVPAIGRIDRQIDFVVAAGQPIGLRLDDAADAGS